MGGYIKKIGIVLVAVIAAVSIVNIESITKALVPGTNELLSKRSTGGLANGHSSKSVASANGNIVVFLSNATNVLPSGGKGVFARDLTTNIISRVSVSTSGVVADAPNNTHPEVISATGRYVGFNSRSSNLIDGTTTPTTYPQLYLRDIETSNTFLVSQTSSGTLSNGTYIQTSGVSSDGRFVTFATNATNLDPDASNGNSHVYMLDRTSGSLVLIDRKIDGTLSTASTGGSMSCEGSLIVINSSTDLLGGLSQAPDVYLVDLRGSSNTITNITALANNSSNGSVISCNGDYIGFTSRANNLDSTVTASSGWHRPYIYNRVSGTYHLAAVTTSNTVTNIHTCGATLSEWICIRPSDTGIGVFAVNDSALTGASGTQVYIRDTSNGTTELISRDSSGTPGNASSGDVNITADGSLVVYSSSSSNLVPSDSNGWSDVFKSDTGL